MPRLWIVAANVLALLGGCNQVLGLDKTATVAVIDTDSDGQVDLDDNCPVTANEDQLDFDFDGAGDACDNCPLYANTRQQNEGEPEGDRDAVGDDCDPNPTKNGDS